MQVNKLFLSKQKTEVVIYGTRQNPRLKDDMSLLYEGTELRRVFTSKYLGVFLDQHLSFNDHVDYLVNETSKKLGALKRCRNNLTLSAAEIIFKAMILPALDYCDVVWQGCGQGNIDSLEKLQRRAAKLIHPKSGIETNELLIKLKLIALEYRRRVHIVIFVKKCLLGIVPPYMLNYIQINKSRSRYTTRNYMDISLPRIRLKITKRSFFIQERWNIIVYLKQLKLLIHLKIFVGLYGHFLQNFRL